MRVTLKGVTISSPARNAPEVGVPGTSGPFVQSYQ